MSGRSWNPAAAAAPEDVAEVLLSSLVVRRPRQFGACWVGCKLWEELALGEFWQKALEEEAGAVPWEKVVEPSERQKNAKVGLGGSVSCSPRALPLVGWRRNWKRPFPFASSPRFSSSLLTC